MIKCPICNAELNDNARFCNFCGSSLLQEYKLYCPECGQEVRSKDFLFCMKCGVKFEGNVKPIEKVVEHDKLICGKCGYVITDSEAIFCRSCGNKFDDDNKPLIWGENDKYYRLCTYCGKAYPLEFNAMECVHCGHKLDMAPRKEPVLTEEEQELIDARIAEEGKKAEIEAEKRRILIEEEEERIRLEEERIKLDEEEAERQRIKAAELKKIRQKKIKKVAKICSIIIILAALIFAGSMYVWATHDEENIALAEEALAAGNYNEAIEYYKKLMPLGSNYKNYNTTAEELAEAGPIYDKALESYNNYSYLDAMEKSQEAYKKCNDLTVAKDLYDNAQADVGRYLQKLFDAGDYKTAYGVVANIEESERNEQMDNIKNSIDDIVMDNITTGRAKFNSGDMSAALEYANAALEINPYASSADEIKSDVENYNEYIGYLQNAYNNYYSGNYSTAVNYYNKVPSNNAGYMAKAKYTTLINNIVNYATYKDNPVYISEKNIHGWYNTFHTDDHVDYTCRLVNRLNLPVTVELKLECNNNVEYRYYTLSAEETRYVYPTMYDTFVYKNNNSWSITLNDTTIQ